MKTLTLIPSANTYGLMLVMVLTIGSFTIARHLHTRWFQSRLSFIGTNALIKSMVVFFGMLIIPIQLLFVNNLFKEAIGLLVGTICGYLVVWAEFRIIRKINRRNLFNKNFQEKISENNILRNAEVTKKFSLTSPGVTEAKGLIHIRQGYNKYVEAPDFTQYSPKAVIIVAIAEEFLFRGYIVFVAKALPSVWLTILVILAGILLFALSHLSNSWDEFKSKLPLSLLTMLGYLITGTLITPIVTHVILNIYAYLELQKIVTPDKNKYMQSGVPQL